MVKKHFWIGVGASAGGLEALKELVQGFNNKDVIYVIAQHLDPNHPTILKDLLERVSQLPVNLVQNDTKPRRGEIYVISPGHNAIIKEGFIVLKPAAAVGPKPSVNEFFTSMASEVGEDSIGIILSGTGSDGAQGIIAIKSAGGIAFSQDELSAKYSGMPRSAIDTGVIDFVLSPSEIAEELNHFINSSSTNATRFSGPKIRTNIQKIFQRIYDQTNYDFSGYKIKTIQRRIQRRMVVNKVVTLDDYITLLMSSSSEVESLFKELLISVTAFFRDPDPFGYLSDTVKKMLETRKPGETIRVWVAGCARGEEAYSIAILFHEAIRNLGKEVKFQIFSTDIDDNALDKARQGTYTRDQVKGVSKELLERYFTRCDDLYLVKKGLRENVVFAKQNLIMDPPFSHLDLISCRNVMIYFNLDTQRTVFQTFHFALKPGGYLFLGKSESATNNGSELFEPENSKMQLFRRGATDTSYSQTNRGIKRQAQGQYNSEVPISELKGDKSYTLKEKMEQTLIHQHVPAAVCINPQGQMLHVKGDLNRFLSIPEGKIDNNILTMARDSLKIDIRSLMQRSKREGKASAQALFYEHELHDHILFLTMSKMDGYETETFFVLAFFDIKVDEGRRSGNVSNESLDNLCSKNLQREVEIFRERLQNSIQDLETTNEELQSTNEELQSANEELQSANEELQTANEELQSTNEELSTVNEELEVKTFELSQVNNDLESMLLSINEIIIFMDTRLRIKRFTHKASREFNLMSSDIGQVLTSYDFAIEILNLRIELLNVIEKEEERVIRLRKNGMNYDLRLVAYKSDDREVVGVILFFEKFHDASQDRDLTYRKMLNIIDDNSRYPVICVAHEGEIVFAGSSFRSALGYDEQDLLAMNIKSLLTEQHEAMSRDLFTEGLSDHEGWRPITLVNSEDNRLQAKYRFSKCPDGSHSEFIVFFDIG
ncbi:MAG: CheR family methyltransferase [Thermodesulfobacteriota bacterium]